MNSHKPKPQEGVLASNNTEQAMYAKFEPQQTEYPPKMKKPDDDWLRAATNGQSGAAAARVEWGDSEMVHPDIVAEKRRMNNAMREAVCGIGISDITARVDANQTPVNVANEAFGACMIRCAMLRGQWLAECSRLQELRWQVEQATDEAVKEACK